MKKTVLSIMCILALIVTLFPVSAEACVAPERKNDLFKPSASQAVKTTRSIKVRWSRGGAAKGYIVKYKPAKSSGKYKKKIVKASKDNSIVLKRLKENCEYTVKITPFRNKKNKNNNRKKRVYGPTKTITGYTYLPAPEYSNSVAAANKIGTDWNDFDYEANLEIARASSPDGPYKTIKKSSSLSVTDDSVEPGGVYYYKARSYKNYSKKMRYSSWSSPQRLEARNSIPEFSMETLTPKGITDTVEVRIDANEYNFDMDVLMIHRSISGDLQGVEECYYSLDGTEYLSSENGRSGISLPPGGSLYLKYVLPEEREFTNTGSIRLLFKNDYTKHMGGFAYIAVSLEKSEAKAELNDLLKCR